MLDPSSLADALSNVKLTSARGPWFRIITYNNLKAKNPPEPLYAKGASLNGARFTPKGSFDTLYLSADPVTPLLEFEAVIHPHDSHPLAIPKPPLLLFSIDGTIGDILDLTDNATVQALGTSPQEICGNWRMAQSYFLVKKGPKPPTQILGDTVFNTGAIKGIKFHSAKSFSGGVNIAIFTDRVKSPDIMRVFDAYNDLPGRLPA